LAQQAAWPLVLQPLARLMPLNLPVLLAALVLPGAQAVALRQGAAAGSGHLDLQA
jgi:hypothetical protein